MLKSGRRLEGSKRRRTNIPSDRVVSWGLWVEIPGSSGRCPQPDATRWYHAIGQVLRPSASSCQEGEEVLSGEGWLGLQRQTFNSTAVLVKTCLLFMYLPRFEDGFKGIHVGEQGMGETHKIAKKFLKMLFSCQR